MSRCLEIPAPRWSAPVFNTPWRFLGLRGGRSCVHKNTRIETPYGPIKICNFKGGAVYAICEDEIVVTHASASESFPEERLYKVYFNDGTSIIVTESHRFLTTDGWIRTADILKSSVFISAIKSSNKTVLWELRDKRVKKIKYFGTEVFWDLHVPELHNYLAQGSINHNSGKSHFGVEYLVEATLLDKTANMVCLRENKNSLNFSSKKLIEKKIYDFGVQDHFDVTRDVIYSLDWRKQRRGITIFTGMRNQTADSIKSLEDFKICLFEEANKMTQYSLDILRPTIRRDDSKFIFIYNPQYPEEPISKFLDVKPPPNALVLTVNFTQNVRCPMVMKEEAAQWLIDNPDTYEHVWLGAYCTKSDDQVLFDKWEADDVVVKKAWRGPYYGVDFGFSTDPLAVTESYVDIETNTLYIAREITSRGVEVQQMPNFLKRFKGIERHVVRADNARPELIRYLVTHGLPRVIAAKKWDGSIKDGISKLRSYSKIIIDVACKATLDEARLYRYKRDRQTDAVLPDVIDKHNHCIDSIRYALEPYIKRQRTSFFTMKDLKDLN